MPKTRYLYLFLIFFGACGGLHYRLNFLAPAAIYLHLYMKFSAPTGGYLFHLKFFAQRRTTVLHIKFFSACNWLLYYTSNFSAPAASYMHYPLEHFGARTELFYYILNFPAASPSYFITPEIFSSHAVRQKLAWSGDSQLGPARKKLARPGPEIFNSARPENFVDIRPGPARARAAPGPPARPRVLMITYETIT